jgi:hypothetical protein
MNCVYDQETEIKDKVKQRILEPLVIGKSVVLIDTSVVYWSEFLARDPEVPVSIPGITRFSEM